MSLAGKHQRGRRRRTEHGPRYENHNPGKGSNSTHVARGRRKHKRRLVRRDRRAERAEMLKAARSAAWYFGAEAVANGAHMDEYRDDIAVKYGYADWKHLPMLLKSDAIKHYIDGRRAERELTGKARAS